MNDVGKNEGKLIPCLHPRVGVLLIALCLWMGGCEKRDKTPSPDTGDSAAQKKAPSTPLSDARRLIELGDADAAAEIVYRHLLQHPHDVDAIFLAARAEAARAEHSRAAEIAGSIEITHERLGKKAAELAAEHAMLAGDHDSAENALKKLVERFSSEPQWKHQLWDMLNRQGRRNEASLVADALTQVGAASLPELQSLIRRGHAFPRDLGEHERAENRFVAGLGLARWLFTKQDYSGALMALMPDPAKEFADPESAALYGRLLAETQAFEQLPAWHARCDQQVRRLNDYWAALGAFFINCGQYEAATRALLEAVSCDPTDRVCYQRLGRALDAMGLSKDAEQARFRGILISQTEELGQRILTEPNNLSLRMEIADKMVELGRPFETLQWIATTLPPRAVQQRAAIDAKRDKLSNMSDLDSMRLKDALLQLEPLDFDLDAVRDETLSPRVDGTSGIGSLPKVESFAVPELVDVAASAQADFQWYHDVEIDLSSIALYESVGGGVGVIDYDMDGWPDLYFAQGAGRPPKFEGTRTNQLLRNIDGQFRSVTSAAAATDRNYSTGIAVGDVNQDGFADIYLGNLGPNRLFINNGDGTFTDSSDRLGVHASRFTSSVAIADTNGDALPDLFECNYIEMDEAFAPAEVGPDGREIQRGPLAHFAESDRWFRNARDGGFEITVIGDDVAKLGSSLGIIITDFDGKPGNEIFVGNDARPNHFLSQGPDDRFSNDADSKGVAYGFHGSANGCMGIATGDFNRDGTLDLHVANFLAEPNNLYLQTQGGFVDAATRFGIADASMPYLGFGTKALDIDRNGWLDLIVSNGHIFDLRDQGEPFKMPPLFMMNMGEKFAVADVVDPSGYWNGEYLGRAIAMLDFDRDHSIDFVITHLDHPTSLLQNRTQSSAHWIQLELIGTTSERDAIGTRVSVTAAGETITQWVTAGDGYFCTDEAVLDIGIGRAESIDSLEVVWPRGERLVLVDIDVDRRYLLIENETEAFERTP